MQTRGFLLPLWPFGRIGPCTVAQTGRWCVDAAREEDGVSRPASGQQFASATAADYDYNNYYKYYVLGRLGANMKSILERTVPIGVYTRTGYCVRPLM